MEKTHQKTFNSEIHRIAHEVADLVISKQKDYGKKNILNSPFGAKHGVVVRLYDKLSRLANLIGNKKEPKNESIIDTFNDGIGYNMIGRMVHEGTFELPMEGDK